MQLKRFWMIHGILLLGLFSVALGSVVLNPSGISFSDIFSTHLSQEAKDIYLWSRIPRILLAAIAGVALSASGVAFQALLRNPLADPYVLGVTGGASLGGIVGLVLFSKFQMLQNPLWFQHVVSFFAFSGAILTMGLIYGLSRNQEGKFSVYSVLLTGVVFTSFTTALIMLINSIADFQQAHELLSWLMGHVGAKSFGTIGMFAVYVALGLVVLFFQTPKFNAMALGESAAESLGVNVERTKRLTFFAASLLVGATVAHCGMIGFVGLIVPHMVRLTIGPDHRILLTASALCGGIFLVLADALGRTLIYPTEIPVGVITALLGGPLFVYLLRKNPQHLG